MIDAVKFVMTKPAGKVLNKDNPLISKKDWKWIQDTYKMAVATATHVRIRVTERGRTTTPAPKYSTRGPKYISTEYADLAGARPPDSSKPRRYKSSSQFHKSAGVRHQTFWVTGGMWRGLVVQNWGTDRGVAIIKFRRTSTGSHHIPEWKRKAYPRKKWKVNNHLKAWTVWKYHKVNVIDMFDDEGQSCVDAVEWKAQLAMKNLFGGEKFTFKPEGNMRLFKRIQREEGYE